MASVYSLVASFSTLALLLRILLLPPADAQHQNDEARTLLRFMEDIDFVVVTESNLQGDYRTTWKRSDDNPCAWVGVTCTNNSTVSQLDLSSWGIGSLPSMEMLSHLKDLRELDLSFNNLQEFPDGIGNLTGLTRLDISHNMLGLLNVYSQVDGILRSIVACRSLRFLSLENNCLSGEIPSLHGLRNLQFLRLANNYFSGPIPQEIGELTSLTSLDLSQNYLTGSVPALPNLTNLVDLNLRYNSLTEFAKLWVLSDNSTLRYLDVSYNRLEGLTPSTIAHLANLRYLNLSVNNLSGEIPSGFSQQLNHSNVVLDLSYNLLTGDIPDDLLNGNSPASVGPDYVCPSIFLSHNNLTGNLRIDSSKYRCFQMLDLSFNNLSGRLSSNFFNQTLRQAVLRLENNKLFGDIVDVLLQSLGCVDILEVLLRNNLFTGDLSRIAVSGLPSISGRQGNGSIGLLDLSNNNLRWTTSQALPDPITATLETLTFRLPSLVTLCLGGNNFAGTSLPKKCFVNQSTGGSIEFLDLSNSHLQGELSSAAFNSLCLSLVLGVNLSNNDLTGPLPESITMLPYITLDVSNNDLSGSLPFIPLNSTLNDPIFFEGNVKLCGYPLPLCPRALPMSWWLLEIIIGGSVTVALVSCLAATWRWKVYSKQHQQDADLIKALMERDSASLMPLRDIRKATDNFADSAQIGEGGFGKVYTGKLCDGTIVAIKRSKREGSEEDKQQFLNEVRILSQVNHRHLVRLLGCCLENKIAALVFEFVSNGTLQEHLESKPGAARLSWTQRLHIAVQTADALNYLHSAATSPIYHRDVKSANILLDEDLNVKVADFGISRLAPLQATHVSTIAVQGTIGYIDPEYYTSYQLTDKSDVYSFGVVLLELISAKPALDFRRSGDNTSLVNLAGPYIARGILEEFVDPSLTETYGEPTGEGAESIMNVGRLAMKCLGMRSKCRPSTKEVLQELENLCRQFTKGCKAVEKGVINSIKKDDQRSEFLYRDHTILVSESSFGNSSSFGMHRNYVVASEVVVPKHRSESAVGRKGQNCIEMSQFPDVRNFTN